MCKKHRPFVPDCFHDITCPKPDTDTFVKVKEQRATTKNKRLGRVKVDKGSKCIVIGKKDDDKVRVDGDANVQFVSIDDATVEVNGDGRLC